MRERTGLVPDPYFSATKLEWILERSELPQEQLAFGTIDSWLAWKLTGGDCARHGRDERLAHDAARSGERQSGTTSCSSSSRSTVRCCRPSCPPPASSRRRRCSAQHVPLAGIAGDQQAALFGQGCFAPGEVKATYGTGTFVLANVGDLAGPAADGLLKTAAAVAPGAPPQFAAEGAVLVGGAALQWLRDGLGVIETAAESERLAEEVDSTGGVFFVPALTGLGSPHWDPEARGLICGLTRGTTRAHLVRAALEAIAHQVADVLDVLPVGAGVLRADGGATANRFLMQLQADLIGSPVEVAADADATALGAAALAGLAVGLWPDVEAVGALVRRGARYEPAMSGSERAAAARGLAARTAPRHGEPVTWVIAHRGASCGRAENTLPAFERAIEVGADYVELDVQVVRRRRPRRLPRPRPRPAHAAPRAAPPPPARRAPRGRDPDARGGGRADRGAGSP